MARWRYSAWIFSFTSIWGAPLACDLPTDGTAAPRELPARPSGSQPGETVQGGPPTVVTTPPDAGGDAPPPSDGAPDAALESGAADAAQEAAPVCTPGILGPIVGRAALSNTASSGTPWADAARATERDNDVASVVLINGGTSEHLIVQDFGVTLPPRAVIVGVEVQVVRESEGGNIFDEELRLVVGGSLAGLDHSAAAPWPATLRARTYGNPLDSWGVLLTEANTSQANFGIALRVRNLSGRTNDTARVDAMRLTLHYDCLP